MLKAVIQMGNVQNPHNNSSGLPDPTAHDALHPIIKQEAESERKVNFLIKMIKFIIRESGFELLNRIEIKEKSTGKVFK